MTLQYDVVSKKQLTEDLVTIIMPAAQQSDWNSQPDAETFLAKVKT
ncbi:hypothetical protein FACS1894166_13250 [Bacilli bacterium]|nr:hypothetical protein FACS1894166_13250 [Bacilli bacterium]